MEDIIIRDVLEKDLASVVDIKISGWQTAYKNIVDDDYLNSFNKEEMIESLKENYKESGFIVAEYKDEVVGFCRYIDSNKYSNNLEEIDCEIVAIYVKPSFKYNGTGTKMFNHAVNYFKEKNKNKMIIWCLKDNEPSKKFYKKMEGVEYKEKLIDIGNKKYNETGFIYEINN